MSSNTVATGPVFDSWWLGPYRESRPIQQTAALDLLLAVVEEGVSVCVVQPFSCCFCFPFILVLACDFFSWQVTCTGAGCKFNPSPATTNPLSCRFWRINCLPFLSFAQLKNYCSFRILHYINLCSDSPCPTGQACCGWEGGFTCCGTNQQCRQGLCQ